MVSGCNHGERHACGQRSQRALETRQRTTLNLMVRTMSASIACRRPGDSRPSSPLIDDARFVRQDRNSRRVRRSRTDIAGDSARPSGAGLVLTVETEGPETPASRKPFIAVLATVLIAFVVYGILATSIDTPRAFSDELLYFDTSASVVEGDGLTIRGGSYRYGPVYPALLIPVHWVTQDRQAAYQLAKILNALLFALTAIPVFLIARSVLEPWTSVGAAAISVAVPSATYVSVVMTESLAYLTFSWALYAILRALQQPSVTRQLVAMGAILGAAGVRTQFIVLFAAYALGLILVLLVPRSGVSVRAALRSLWPTWAFLALALGLVTGAAAFGSASSQVLGNYSVLWRSYDPIEVGRWLTYHLANLDLYLAVVPFAVAPIVIRLLFARGRNGARRDLAFIAVFVTVNALLILQTSLFNTTKFAGNLLHDRPLFYVLPLWLIVLFVWISAGMPRPFAVTLFGVAIAFALPLTLPFSGYAHGNVVVQFEAMATSLWVAVDEIARGAGVSGVVGVFIFTLVLALAVVLLPRRQAYVFPAVVLTVFLVTAELSWFSSRSWAESRAKVPERSWVDENTPARRSVTLLTRLSPCARDARDAFYLSEFFNASVTRAAHLGDAPDALPRLFVYVERDGSVVTRDRTPLRADHVVTQSRLPLAGRKVAIGANGRLVLWDVSGPVRVLGAKPLRDPSRLDCRRSIG